MQSRPVLGALTLAFVAANLGCVMPDQMSQIQKDLADVQSQLTEMRKEQADTRQRLASLDGNGPAPTRGDDGVSREQVADIDVRVHQAVRNSEINEERLGDLQRRVERMAREIDETRDMAQRVVPSAPMGGDGGTALDPGAGDESPTYSGGLPPTGSAPAADPDELYNTAYADFSKGNYELAVAGFEEFYDSFPRSAVADNALYWIGECYFSQGNFPLAIRAFDRLLATFPDSDKAAAGNLKKGLAYLEQNQVRQAIVQLQHVHTAYAGSDEARVARDKLTALGAPI